MNENLHVSRRNSIVSLGALILIAVISIVYQSQKKTPETPAGATLQEIDTTMQQDQGSNTSVVPKELETQITKAMTSSSTRTDAYRQSAVPKDLQSDISKAMQAK